MIFVLPKVLVPHRQSGATSGRGVFVSFFPTFDFIIVLILYGVYICYHVDIFVLFGLTREHRGMGIDFATTKKINAILLRTSSTFQKSLICDNHFSFLANFCWKIKIVDMHTKRTFFPLICGELVGKVLEKIVTDQWLLEGRTSNQKDSTFLFQNPPPSYVHVSTQTAITPRFSSISLHAQDVSWLYHRETNIKLMLTKRFCLKVTDFKPLGGTDEKIFVTKNGIFPFFNFELDKMVMSQN